MNESAHFSFFHFLKGLLLVVLQIAVLAYRLILSSIKSLGNYGRTGRLPSSGSEFPVRTLTATYLKPFAIILTCVMAILLAIPTFGASLFFGVLLVLVVAYGFEVVGMLVAAVNSSKEIERK